MKSTITALFLLLSSLAFSQDTAKVKPIDSVTLRVSLQQLNIIYAAVNKSHGDHVVIAELLDLMMTDFKEQSTKK